MLKLTAVSPTNAEEPLLPSGDGKPTGPPFRRGNGLLNRFKNAVTPLTHAPGRTNRLIDGAKSGNLEMVEQALRDGADINATVYDWARYINDGMTPLHHASLGGHEKVVRLLLDRGAAVDARDIAGYTPLYAASMGGHSDVVRELLSGEGHKGATVSKDLLNVATNDEIKELLKEAMLKQARGGTPAIGGRRRRRYTQTKRTKRTKRKTNTRKK